MIRNLHLLFWGIFANETSAQEFINQEASKYVFDFDLEIVDLYEFLFLEDIDREKIQEVYRHPEQNKVMLQRKAEQRKVLDYKQFNESRGKETKVIDVDPVQTPNLLMPQQPVSETLLSEIKEPPKMFNVEYNEKDNVKVDQSDFQFLRRPIHQENQK